MTAKELTDNWLKDAYGMEKALADYVKKSIDDFKDNDAIQTQLKLVLEQNESAIEKLQQLLEQRGSKPSAVKDVIGDIVGFVSGAGSKAFGDDAVKNILVIHGVFHFAHICYMSLRVAGEQQDDMALASFAEGLEQQRLDTADWAQHTIDGVTRQALTAAA